MHGRRRADLRAFFPFHPCLPESMYSLFRPAMLQSASATLSSLASLSSSHRIILVRPRPYGLDPPQRTPSGPSWGSELRTPRVVWCRPDTRLKRERGRALGKSNASRRAAAKQRAQEAATLAETHESDSEGADPAAGDDTFPTSVQVCSLLTTPSLSHPMLRQTNPKNRRARRRKRARRW